MVESTVLRICLLHFPAPFIYTYTQARTHVKAEASADSCRRSETLNAEEGKRLNKTRMPDQQLRILIIGDLKACDEKDQNIIFSSVINSLFFLLLNDKCKQSQ